MYVNRINKEETIDITEDLLEGLRQLGQVLRNEVKPVSAWELLDELGKDEKVITHE